MRFLYNLAAILIVTIIIPIFVLRATRERGFIERIKQSFGFYPQETIEKVAGKNAIWVHAASVGEIVATSPLVREFRKVFPDSPILVSVVTTGGYEMAHRIIKDADAIIYFPLDLPFRALWGASVRAYSCPSKRSFGRISSKKQSNSTFPS